MRKRSTGRFGGIGGIGGIGGRALLAAAAASAVVALGVAACAQPVPGNHTGSGASSSAVRAAAPSGPQSLPTSSPHPATYLSTIQKVMVIPEENETESSIIGSSSAPYLTSLATTYGTATNMNAGYPTACPSLAAYMLMTSGSQQGICDDLPPSSHHVTGDNIFSQVANAGLQWRVFAESMTTNCQAVDGTGSVYVVRHAVAPYYASEASRCLQWQVPLGTTTSGALRTALADGLPSYSMVVADTCHDMHGASSCPTGLVAAGDTWLRTWLPRIMAGTDFTHNKLAIIITWDEGSSTSNHIPTLVISNATRGVSSATAYTHCSNLATVEQILSLPLLGCAASAPSFVSAFHL